MRNTQWMILLVAVVMVATVPLAGAVQYSWNGTEEPINAFPEWTRPLANGAGTTGYTQNGDGTGTIWTVATNYHREYRMADPVYWDHVSTGESIVECRVKLDGKAAADTLYGASFGLGSDSNYWVLFFDTDGIVEFESNEKVLVDTSAYHTYKLVINPAGTNADFYVDGVFKATWSGVETTTAERMDFGDFSADVGGTSTWDYVQWENGIIDPSGVVIASDTQPALEISWPSVASAPYQPEYASNLVVPNWVNLGAAVTGNGATKRAYDSMANPANQRFYRVVSQPSGGGATQHEWDGSAEPNLATPAWWAAIVSGVPNSSYTDNGDGTGTIMTAGKSHSRLYRMEAPGGVHSDALWDHDGSGNSVVEWRVKVDSLTDSAEYAGGIQFGTGVRVWTLQFATNGIKEFSGNTISVDTTAYHDYKAVIAADSSQLDFYIDGAFQQTWSGAFSSANRLDIGEFNGNWAGTTTWDYVRWKNGFIPSAVPFSISMDDAASIRWPTVLGTNYLIQYTTDAANWFNLGTMIPGDGTTNTVYDSVYTPARSYRVWELDF